ncbi:hypothetical protein TVAG_285830 [Trichomonas vaginalis G3]|uniref:Baseplate structural protein Gp10 C-terminal domain-containing protein n=1 Tax=Trichomonas vaginalis (strain ATCC PRA-98 / G3) TaxID=412133 RepID=A2GCK0_TRIV3|nr:hypothetical protein TVAG_285830 [Trichomonas vaginalis G3]|eukprot:XP_001298048.1 hypothetical protein [Trichomonas vaginalis G3]
MSKDIASMREIQHNRQLIMQALNKNTTNFSNYSKISESLKEGNLKLTLNPMTDEFLFQDKKNNTVCINPTKGTLNEKPINELLLKADVDNKADKEYVDDAIAKEEERANNAYATKEHTHPELADKTYVDNKMSSEVTRAENEYSKKTHTHYISEITDLQETLNSKSAVGHTHTIANITNLQETLNSKSNVGHTHTIANITNLQETLNRKSAVGHTHSISEITDLNVSLEKKADKNHTHTIANITNLQETLNRKSAVGHTHSISEITDLNVSLEKKADKNHTHDFFTTVAIESIEGTVEETGGDALYCKPPNFPQGLTSDDNITTMRNIRCKDVYVMKDEYNIKFTAQDLYDKKADKTELQTLKTEILQTLYPIGSIYTSMNSTRPEVVLGFGTWTQIVDRFLYCANSSKETVEVKRFQLKIYLHTVTT